MGTQFHRLTTPRSWGTEAVQLHSAWNLEAQHVVSQARLQLPERIPEASSTRGPITCVALQTKTDPDRHHPFCTPLSPSGRPLPCCGFRAWSLLGPNPNPTPNTDTPPKPKPASNPNPAIEPPSDMDAHFSARGRSQDQSRFGPGNFPGRNPNPS